MNESHHFEIPNAHISRRQVILAATAIGLSVAGCGNGSRGSTEQQADIGTDNSSDYYDSNNRLKELDKPVNLNVAYSLSVSNLGVAIASASGYFKRHNLVAKPVSFQGSTEVAEAFSAGKIDAGDLGLLPAMVAQGAGAGVSALSTYAYGGNRYSLIARKGVTSYEQLRGKAIAALLGSDVQLAALIALKKHNIRASDVSFVNMQWAAMPAAAESGSRIAAYNQNEPIGSAMIAKLPDKVHMLERLGDYFSGAGLFSVRNQWANKNPLAARHAVVAVWEAMKFVRENPDKAAEALTKASKGRIEVADTIAGMKYVKYDPRLTPQVNDELSAAQELAERLGKLNTRVSVKELTEPGFSLLKELEKKYAELLPTS